MPARALATRARLFRALERTHRVSFEGREPGAAAGLDGVVAFAPASPPPGLPSLVFSGGGPGARAPVNFSSSGLLDQRLRNRRLVEERPALIAEPGAPAGQEVLACCAGAPAWLRRGPLQMVAGAPAELRPGEPLRARITAGRFLEALPLVHFLRELAPGPWNQPPLRACLVFDDPNLRATAYGHLRYRELAAHARRHGYHAAIASIPLDYRFVNPAAAALFREHPAQLSLAIHGNNHERMELERTQDEEAATALAAQALRRAASLESRHGLRVCRVMCPPHEVCGEVMTRAMFRLGFEALTLEPLLSGRPEDGEDAALDGFECAGIAGGGLPVIPRYPLAADPEDLPLRAFLNLPLVLYGHHSDVQHGLDGIGALVERVAGLGQVSWLPLSEVARSNYLLQRDGGELRVRLHSVLAQVPVPEGVERISVELPHARGAELGLRVDGRAIPFEERRDDEAHAVQPLSAGAASVSLEVVATRRLDARQVKAPARRVWPVLRRTATEARDRVAPLRSRRVLGRAVSRPT